jgi:SAM-dependent MidA family methyltransferase
METPLASLLVKRIEAEGPLPFAEFMRWALYHPEHGYYTSGSVNIGRDEGDFTTAPHLSGLFARCVARLVLAADRALGGPEPFTLAEGGPGEGRLGRDLLDTIRACAPALYARLRYAPNETSPALRERQAELWEPHRSKIGPWPPPYPTEGLYFSNELVDAFPVHRLIRRDGEIAEIHVTWDGQRFTEVDLPLRDPELAAYVAEMGIEIPEDCEVDVNLEALRWLSGVVRSMVRGFVVTLDYGDEAARLHGSPRPEGTVLGYRGHRVTTDLLAEPGRQDLTAHVDFTALQRAGERQGWRAAPLLTLRDFLFAHGILEELESLERLGDPVEQLSVRRAVAPLLLPGSEMGESFKALVQARGVDPADLTRGSPQPLRL